MSLTNQILECVRATDLTVPDYDQRSAIGIARTWVEQRDFKRSEYHPGLMARRDDLAERLIAILAESDDADEMVASIREARQILDEPFIDEKMLGFRARRAERGEFRKKGKAAKQESS